MPRAEHVGGGLVAGEQQQEGDTGQFLDGQVVVAGQVGQDVLAGAGALARDQFGQIRAQRDVGGHLLFDRLVLDQELGGVDLEGFPVGVGDTEQFADHQRRHRQCEHLDEVDRWGQLRHQLELLLGDVDDVLFELLHPLDGEGADELAPQPGVVRRVHGDEHARHLRGRFGGGGHAGNVFVRTCSTPMSWRELNRVSAMSWRTAS